MDEFDGICPACQRVWNIRLMAGSEAITANSFVMLCPYCQVTAPRAMKMMVMKRAGKKRPQEDTINTERIT